MAGASKGSVLERIAVVHAVVFVVGVPWAFGGNADWVRAPISAWGAIGIVLAAVAVATALAREGRVPRAARWAWPVLALNLLVLLSGRFPGFRTLVIGGDPLLVPVRVPWWQPTSTDYSHSLAALLLFDGIYFSCLGIALTVRSRGTLRTMLGLVVANAAILAVFGIVQKLLHEPGIYFGAFPSPNTAFFASFVYDNHWGAFMVLMLGAAWGLILRYAHGVRGWGFIHGPALTLIVCACLMMISVPLSGSRACTLIVAALGAYAVARGASRIRSGLHASGMAPALASLAVVAGICVAAFGIWAVAGETVRSRAEVTRLQAIEILSKGGGLSRKAVYSDTWRMARQKPVFGWGMASYPTVFPIFNTQVRPTERLPIIYHDAHSDWLQSLAELGFAGTLLLVAAVALPARALLEGSARDLPLFLAVGCLLVGLYAAVEFPFGNVAVTLSWWFCFMVATQYAVLSGRAQAEGAE